MTFLSVIDPSYPPPNFALSKSTRVSIVGVLGESKTSSAATFDASLGATTVVIASTLAAYPHFSQSTYVSSPVSHGAKNSSDADPPMAPDTALTMLYFIRRRSKVLMYAARWRM